MNVFIERENATKEVAATTVSELLQQLQINPETVLITKNGTLVPEDEPLNDSDNVKILSVISGG